MLEFFKNKKKRKNKGNKKHTIKSKTKRRIKKSLVLYFSILISVFALGTGYLSVKSSRAALIDAATSSITLAGQEASEYVASRIETELRTLEVVAMRNDIIYMDW